MSEQISTQQPTEDPTPEKEQLSLHQASTKLASKTSDLSAPLKAPAHLSEPPGRKGAAPPPAPPARPGPARPGPAPLLWPAPPARLPSFGPFPGPHPGPFPRPSLAPPSRAAPGHGRRGRSRGAAAAGPRGLRGCRWAREGWAPCSSLKVPSCRSPHPCIPGGWGQSLERDTSAAARRAEPAWEVCSPCHGDTRAEPFPREAGATFCRLNPHKGESSFKESISFLKPMLRLSLSVVQLHILLFLQKEFV
ncbi:WW domain-binding protein 11-like [Oenanthe melanoleuca]|uniref:WW domain-binding protein 11-like n=1 Tax=Oenanthe melanoleuca TaxID=2939378 RepID=UPI0024C12A54|nr:WW domain-binding protein 11-like [Oenanthe melanoleuca]